MRPITTSLLPAAGRSGRSRRLARLVPLVAVALLGAAAGRLPPDHPADPHPPPAVATVAPAPIPAPAPAPAPIVPSQVQPDTVFTFESLLGHHASLVCRLMRAELRDDPDFLEAASDAVVANTDELAAAVAAVHGAPAGEAFRQLWGRHVDLFFDYANGLAQDDADAVQDARDNLDAYRGEWGGFIEQATNGAIPAATAAENLRVHIDQILDHADAYAAEDYPAAMASLRDAFAHMFPTGQALVGGLAAAHPGELPVALDDPAQQLQSTLGRLLGEHFELAVDLMRSGVAGLADFEALAGAVDANTRDLTGAVDALVGSAPAMAFNQAWADHIDALVDYTAGLGERDDAARQAALDRMAQVRQGLATAFSQLTGGTVPVATAAEVLATHDDQLVSQADAYAAADYDQAHRVSNDGYHHMFDTAAALASAITAAMAPQMPAGAPQTGGGGTAGNGRHGPHDRHG
jgi:hypothetical protein